MCTMSEQLCTADRQQLQATLNFHAQLLTWFLIPTLHVADECSIVIVAQCVGMLERARRVGIAPNAIMVNTAMSALGKAGRPADATALFARHLAPDAVAHETLVAAHGLAGDAAAAEAAFAAMQAAGHSPRDYSYTGLVRAMASSFQSLAMQRLLAHYSLYLPCRA